MGDDFDRSAYEQLPEVEALRARLIGGGAMTEGELLGLSYALIAALHDTSLVYRFDDQRCMNLAGHLRQNFHGPHTINAHLDRPPDVSLPALVVWGCQQLREHRADTEEEP